MKKISLLKEVENYPIFNNKIIRELTKKGNNYAKLLIHRLKKEGLISEIEKNKYTVHEDPLIIASHIIWPSYLSCWTSLRYFNLTEQLPRNVFVITTRAKKEKEIIFKKTKIIFIKTKPKYFFGFKKERYNNFDIFIAEPEKAIIDSVLFKKISFSEIIDIIKTHRKEFNYKLFKDYLIKIKNKSLIKRFGFLFDSLKIDYYKNFKKYMDNKYILLDYAMPKKEKKNKKWKIIENVRL
jgi:predicted transcriptional regulator of viral defense system